ncbi:alpha/beta hydrolase family protein [Emydomyces testavorans]|uniref:cutinase n=1 Tax=Emydomyces testavorans TaxID=2070801 RepID=A0AAF0DI03_9EURO|nr:alpha/beta hydrolase family protein [Emydomyces testavorans]
MKVELLLLFLGLSAYVTASPIAAGPAAQATSADHDIPLRVFPAAPPAAVATGSALYRVRGRDNNADAVPPLPDMLHGLAKFLSDEKGLKGSSGPAKATTGAGSNVENGIKENKSCEPLTLIFARGTEEAGNMGTVVGPALATALRKLLNNKVTIQGVDYPATVADTLDLGTDGGPEMANLVKQGLTQCPSSKIVVAGYSQGAMVMHDAAEILGVGEVTAAIVFGDPLKFLPLNIVPPGDLREFCAAGDPVCGDGNDVSIHKSYAANAEEAARFIVMTAGIQ